MLLKAPVIPTVESGNAVRTAPLDHPLHHVAFPIPQLSIPNSRNEVNLHPLSWRSCRWPQTVCNMFADVGA